MATCPMKNLAGTGAYCDKKDCAWWDDEYKQCCVKSLMYSQRALPIQSSSNNDNSHLYQTPPIDFGRVNILKPQNPYEITYSKDGGNNG